VYSSPRDRNASADAAGRRPREAVRRGCSRHAPATRWGRPSGNVDEAQRRGPPQAAGRRSREGPSAKPAKREVSGSDTSRFSDRLQGDRADGEITRSRPCPGPNPVRFPAQARGKARPGPAAAGGLGDAPRRPPQQAQRASGQRLLAAGSQAPFRRQRVPPPAAAVNPLASLGVGPAGDSGPRRSGWARLGPGGARTGAERLAACSGATARARRRRSVQLSPAAP
jgi:hypothetical protein